MNVLVFAPQLFMHHDTKATAPFTSQALLEGIQAACTAAVHAQERPGNQMVMAHASPGALLSSDEQPSSSQHAAAAAAPRETAAGHPLQHSLCMVNSLLRLTLHSIGVLDHDTSSVMYFISKAISVPQSRCSRHQPMM